VIPRIGASVTFYGTAVLRQFEMMGVMVLNKSDAILRARDKLRCLQLLAQQGIGLPGHGVRRQPRRHHRPAQHAGPPPHVVKLVEGRPGHGSWCWRRSRPPRAR
jgi:ribosomal protein S6--L-glutamate ligase